MDFLQYDFKGNLVETSRRVVNDAVIAAGWIADWAKPNSDNDLEPAARAYETDTTFDALNRPIRIIYPQEAKRRQGETTPHRAALTPHYDRAGALQAVELDGTPHVSFIGYNAKGQRLFVAFGNERMTRLVYDPLTFRLARLRSERYQLSASGDSWQGQGEPLQDCVYRYDPAGNIILIEERVKRCGVENSSNGSDRLVRQFAYDPVYRLTSAGGRACKDVSGEFVDVPGCGYYTAGGVPNQDNAPSLTEIYQQSYSYDPAGNILEMDYDVRRPAGSMRLWVRQFGFGGLPSNQWRNASNDRLTSVTIGATTHNFQFDDNGNLKKQDTEKSYLWDHADRMVGYRLRAGAQPSIDARYLYGADGIRVKKWVKSGPNQIETTVYASASFEFSAWPEATSLDPNQGNRLHVTHGQNRISILAVGDRRSDDAGPPLQYHLGDHLGSSNVVADDAGAWINREEYFPYGETSFGSFARKRYRFSGKEQDKECGFLYYGARYYVPSFARWVSTDVPGLTTESNLYQSFRDSPIKYMDPSGLQDVSGTPDAPTDHPPTSSNNIDPVPDEVAGFRGGPLNCSDYNLPPTAAPLQQPAAIGESGVRLRADTRREHYENFLARYLAARGHLNLAEIAEAGHGCAYCHIVKSYSSLAEANADIDLAHYNTVARVLHNVNIQLAGMVLTTGVSAAAAPAEGVVAEAAAPKNLLMVGPESTEEFNWLSAQGKAGWSTTAVNPARTSAATAFESGGGRFIESGVENVGETFNWTHESFPQPLGRTLPAMQAYQARLGTLAPGGRLTILTENQELIDMYRSLTTTPNAPFTFSESLFTAAHPEAGLLPPATSTYVAPGSNVWLLNIFLHP